MTARQSGAVISDFAVRTPFSAEEFAALTTSPVGYTPFHLFHVGDYEYQQALVRVSVHAPSLGNTPQMYNMMMNVDIDDTVSRGQTVLKAEDTLITYGKPYYTRPEVTATLSGGFAADTSLTIVLENIDTSGFHAKLVRPDGTLAAGTISWTAVGY